MKLKELLEKYAINDTLEPYELEKLKEELLKCDEFENITEIIIINSPAIEVNGKAKFTQTRILKEDNDFKYGKGTLFIYQIYFIPGIEGQRGIIIRAIFEPEE